MSHSAIHSNTHKIEQLYAYLHNDHDWDGSYLGILSRKQIVCKFIHESIHYWLLYYNGMYLFGDVITLTQQQCKNACLIDECKECFNLAKIGRHYFKYKRNYYLLDRIQIQDTRAYKNYCHLHQLSVDLLHDLNYEIQQCMLFRYIMGVPYSPLDSLAYYEIDNKCYVISKKEYTYQPANFKLDISNYIYKIWFEDIIIADVLLNQLQTAADFNNKNLLQLSIPSCTDTEVHHDIDNIKSDEIMDDNEDEIIAKNQLALTIIIYHLRTNMSTIFQRLEVKQQGIINPIMLRLQYLLYNSNE